MPTVDPFERAARKVRARLHHLPLLEPVVNRMGVWLWRQHLNRLCRRHALHLPPVVTLDPSLVRRRLPAGVLPREAGVLPPQGTGVPRTKGPREVGGSWDLAAAPLGELDRASPEGDDDESIAIAFDRRGRPCLVSGRTALARASRAGEAVEASVVLRHTRWARLAKQVMAYAEQRGGSAYQPYLHPDLASLPSDQGHERFQPLLDALPIRGGTLVDLGANAGYFSHRFESAGFRCIAVERSEKEAVFLTALRDALDRRFTVLKGSLAEVPLPGRVDVVLALNIFHHFLKSDDSFATLQDFLSRLDTRYMLFESHLPGDPQMRTASRDMAPGEFAEFVATTAGLERVEELEAAADGRPLFLLAAAGEARTG